MNFDITLIDIHNSNDLSFRDSHQEDPFPQNLIEIDGKLFFTAKKTPERPWGFSWERTLYVSDGTAVGTHPLTDINGGDILFPGDYSQNGMSDFIEFNEKLFFTAYDSDLKLELYVSDGTATGTQLITDVNNPLGSPSLFALTEVNGKLFFRARGEQGDELYVSDGTAAGTQLVTNISNDNIWVGDFTKFDGKLFFVAEGGQDSGLYVSDGTAAGTQLFTDISWPSDFTEFNGKLFFSADNGAQERELYVINDVASGTEWFADINPNGSSDPSEFTEFEEKLFFSATGAQGRELYVSDGTAAGTQLFADINPNGDSRPSDFIEFDGKLFFVAEGGQGRELYKTDGTAAGTQLILDINPSGSSFPSNFAEFDGKLFFTADNGEQGHELYVTDGTAAGTQLVADLEPGQRSSYLSFYPTNFPELDGKLFFNAGGALYSLESSSDEEPTDSSLTPFSGAVDNNIYVNGSENVVEITLLDINPDGGSFPSAFTEVDGQLFFTAQGKNGRKLYVTDGTVAGTQLIDTINPNKGSSPSNLTEFDGKLFFRAEGEKGRELYVSDGTAEGTQLAVDINLNGNSDPSNFVEFNGKLFFSARGEKGRELYVSDGTAEGTQLVADINPTGDSSLYSFKEFDGKLLFRADGGQGPGLYVTDGTPDNTQLLANINPLGSLSTKFDEKLFFSADGDQGEELYVTDGTPDGTQLVADINPNGDSSPIRPTEFNGKLFFSADGGQGRELYVSDGTAAGTRLFADINPDGGSFPSVMTELDGKLFFSAKGTQGRELYVTDGTTAGTQLVADINPNGDSAPSYNFAEFDGKLFFAANGAEGFGVYRTDGTETGTQLVASIGPESEYPFISFIEFDGKLFFSAQGVQGYEPYEGYELYMSDGTTEGTQLIADIRSNGDSAPFDFTEFDGKLFFTALGEQGRELYVLATISPAQSSLAAIEWNTETGVVSTLGIDLSTGEASTTALGRTIEDNNWALQTLGDLNGDGQADVILRHAVLGTHLAWYMAPGGQSIKSEAVIGRDIPDANWSIGGTGNLNDDGKTDLILHNQAADQFVAWYMDGSGGIESEAIIGRGLGDNNWEIAATADFNGDRKTDIVLSNRSSGEIVLWEMDGGEILAESLIGRNIADPNWYIEGAADFDQNGTVDLFLRYREGGIGLLWSMADKNTIASEQVIANVPTGTSQLVF